MGGSFDVMTGVLALEVGVVGGGDLGAPSFVLNVHLALFVDSGVGQEFAVLDLLSGVAGVTDVCWGDDISRILSSILRLSQQSSRITSYNSFLHLRRFPHILRT